MITVNVIKVLGDCCIFAHISGRHHRSFVRSCDLTEPASHEKRFCPDTFAMPAGLNCLSYRYFSTAG
jgi:hypothetical protein